MLGAGIALSILGVAGYAAGVAIPYPGRAFSVTAVMVGLTLVAIGRSLDSPNGGEQAAAGGQDGTDTATGGESP
jgi:hypothetical protein